MAAAPDDFTPSRRTAPHGRGKLPQLEGARGLAAMIVVAWHFIWAFAPWELGSVAGGAPGSGIIGSPAAASIDGPAAVALFFVLSGFVLPLGFLRSGRTQIVLHAAAKRWLRLAGLSVLSVLLSYVLFRCGLFRFRVAGHVTHSAWLASYGGGDPHGALQPTLLGALREGLVWAFVHKSDAYNPALWTMHHELVGSFVSLGVALVIWNRSALIAGAVLLAAAALSPLADPWLLAFLAGTGLAFLVCRGAVRLHWSIALCCVAAGLFLFGYLEPAGAYAAVPVMQDSAGYRYDRILVHTTSGVLIMLGLIGNEALGRALSIRPFRMLGRVSFPVYLFHFQLLCSLGCCLFLLLRPTLPYFATLAVVAALYMPVVLLVGLVFARVDEAWTVWVNRGTDRVLGWSTRRPSPAA